MAARVNPYKTYDCVELTFRLTLFFFLSRLIQVCICTATKIIPPLMNVNCYIKQYFLFAVDYFTI